MFIASLPGQRNRGDPVAVGIEAGGAGQHGGILPQHVGRGAGRRACLRRFCDFGFGLRPRRRVRFGGQGVRRRRRAGQVRLAGSGGRGVNDCGSVWAVCAVSVGVKLSGYFVSSI